MDRHKLRGLPRAGSIRATIEVGDDVVAIGLYERSRIFIYKAVNCRLGHADIKCSALDINHILDFRTWPLFVFTQKELKTCGRVAIFRRIEPERFAALEFRHESFCANPYFCKLESNIDFAAERNNFAARAH